MFRFGLFNPNNMTARGATLLRSSLFLAISVNNTQSIVCGGLEKHLPWPSRGDPVYLIEAAVSNQCLSGIFYRHLLHPHAPQVHTYTYTTRVRIWELAFIRACTLLGNCKDEESRRLVWSLAKYACLYWPQFRETFAHTAIQCSSLDWVDEVAATRTSSK